MAFPLPGNDRLERRSEQRLDRHRREAPLHISKVSLADPKDGKATRVRFETKDGKKVRVAVKSGETIDG